MKLPDFLDPQVEELMRPRIQVIVNNSIPRMGRES
jgi:hypothetical protein